MLICKRRVVGDLRGWRGALLVLGKGLAWILNIYYDFKVEYLFAGV